MTLSLDALLASLHSDAARLKLLRATYAPGNVDVADRILAIAEDSSVLEKEIAVAQNAGDIERFKSMARKHIDYYVLRGLDTLLPAKVIKWQDPALALYAIGQLANKHETGGNLKQSLSCSAEIAQAFGEEGIARVNLERLLALQEKDDEYQFNAAATLEKLGRFDEAIDRYFACNTHGWLRNAMNLAREHSPNRVFEVAGRGFDSFEVEKGWPEFYVECAEVLGKTDEAKMTLVKYAAEVKIRSSPGLYGGVVKALVSLGREDAARQLVEKVAQYELKLKKSGRPYEYDRPYELAGLYHAIGETDAAGKIYGEVIDARIREGRNSSSIVSDINTAIELTGDRRAFMEKMLLLHEMEGAYGPASELALELGLPELADAYAGMGRMVQPAAANQ